MLSSLPGVIFDGLAYGMLLFLVSVGLSVTLGLLNFVNLAHGAFAMLGGYLAVAAVRRLDAPFALALVAAAAGAMVAGWVLERTLYRLFYRRSPLDQVLFTIGLTFMAIAAATWLVGPQQQTLPLPPALSGQYSLLGVDLNRYRTFLLGIGLALTVGLTLALERTRLGAAVRASVDNVRVAEALGIRTGLVLQLTFVMGCGLAGLGGALGVEVLGLDPAFPLTYIVTFLLVVAVGGTGNLKGPLLASLLVGVVDIAGKYYLPQAGAFIIYALMVLLLIVRPQGLAGRETFGTHGAEQASGQGHARPGPRLRRLLPGLEAALWLLLLAGFWLWPTRLALGSQILIAALFALSCDLLLGYAGIVSLGHAASFGIGAYAAGLLARYGWGEPLSGLALGTLCAGAVGWLTGFLVVPGRDLTRLMVTTGIGLLLFELANRLVFVTGGVDGLQGVEMAPLLGWFRFDMYGRTAYGYTLAVALVFFLGARRLVGSAFGLGLRGIRGNAPRMAALGYPVHARLIAVYTLAAAMAGAAGALLAQTTQFVSIDVFGFQRSAELLVMLIVGGTGMLYGGLVGAAAFMVAHQILSDLNPIYWEFWLGAFLIAIVLLGRGGVLGALRRAAGALLERPPAGARPMGAAR